MDTHNAPLFHPQPGKATSTSAALSDLPGMDVAGALRRLRGNLPQYCKLLELFISKYEHAEIDLRQLLASGNQPAAHFLVHSLKGVAAALGANGLAQTAQTLESAIHADVAHDQLLPMVDQFSLSLNALLMAIREGHALSVSHAAAGGASQAQNQLAELRAPYAKNVAMSTNPNPPTLLVVDDVAENIEVLNNILEQDYRVKVATNGEKALSIVMSDHPPDLILLDILMPGIDGYEVCRRIKANPARRGIPIMFVTSMEDQEDEALGLALGAEDYITKPFNPYIVLARVKTHLALYDQTRELERKVDERTRELQSTRLQIIQRLGKAAEFRDNETGFHVSRMSRYSRLIALAASLPEEQAELLLLSAPMHDIGKIGTPDYVLLKPAKLDAKEWSIMQQHASIGAEIIGDHDDPLLAMARSIAASHHEKWDGSGYPEGLKGEDIPLAARIVAIADVFDALTSLRPYKVAWSVAKACQTIVDDAGRHFDPELIQAFLKALPEILEVKERYVELSVDVPLQRTQPVDHGTSNQGYGGTVTE